MQSYRYKAANPDGQVVEGLLKAADRESVARQLLAQGRTPLHIADDTGGQAESTPVRREKPKRSAGRAVIDHFTLELSTLLRAGLPLGQALDTLIELADSDEMADLAGRVNREVRAGHSLSESLEKAHPAFAGFYCNMVRAGESSGALDLALARLAEFRSNQHALKQSLMSALLYPAILLVLALVAVAVLLAFVVPQFTQMFADAGRELPLLTRIVATTGEMVTQWWWLGLLVIFGTGWWLRRDWRTQAGRLRWDERLLRLPLAGDLARKLATARFSRTLATLLENGVNLVPGLEIARQVAGNSIIAQRLGMATRRVREGAGLGAALAESQALPTLAQQLIRLGEKTGNLEPMLGQIAEIYERDVQTSMKRLLTLAEPAIIVTIALMITVIILSVVLMILESNDLAF